MEIDTTDQKIGEYVKGSFEKLFSENLLSEDDINNLKNLSFCKEKLGLALNLPILETDETNVKDSKGNSRYWKTPFESKFGKFYVVNHWIEPQRDKFDEWKDSFLDREAASDEKVFQGQQINVYVGYAWHKGRAVYKDQFWASIRDYLLKIKKSIEKHFGEDKINVSIKRLRSSHGNFIFNEVLKRIEDSDLLIFDVAGIDDMFDSNGNFLKPLEEQKKDIPSTDAGDVPNETNDKPPVEAEILKYSKFNPNVLFEVGLALGKEKSPFLLCPKALFKGIPSDLSNYMWSTYISHIEDDKNNFKLRREFCDAVGFRNKITGILATRANELLKENSNLKK